MKTSISKPFTAGRGFFIAAIAAAWIASALSAQAAPFEIAAAPARFEVSTESGKRLGQSIDIHNVGLAPTEVKLRTIDWTYSEDGKITYHDELLPGSCRPWVTLERKTVSISPRSKIPFRFEVNAPVGAPRGECRFMIAIEGVEPSTRALVQQDGVGLSLPVSGRIAVAVYVLVNGAEPQLALKSVGMRTTAKGLEPVVTVTNSGDAHGRIDGALEAVGADGKSFDLVPEGSPILPGQTRELVLTARIGPTGTPMPMKFPVDASGTLDWDRGSFKINAQFK